MCGLAVASALALAPAALAQAGDPLAPPPDLGGGPLPVPQDGTAIPGSQPGPPAGYMAIPVPPSTCSGVQSVVRSQGFILIPTGNGNAQRYVLDQRYCPGNEDTKPAWIATSDSSSCFVGYTCTEPFEEEGN